MMTVHTQNRVLITEPDSRSNCCSSPRWHMFLQLCCPINCLPFVPRRSIGARTFRTSGGCLGQDLWAGVTVSKNNWRYLFNVPVCASVTIAWLVTGRFRSTERERVWFWTDEWGDNGRRRNAFVRPVVVIWEKMFGEDDECSGEGN